MIAPTEFPMKGGADHQETSDRNTWDRSGKQLIVINPVFTTCSPNRPRLFTELIRPQVAALGSI